MPPSIRRSSPECKGYTPFAVLNVEDGETVYQTWLLVSGQCHDFDNASKDDFVSVKCNDGCTQTYGPQTWPVAAGKWKALVKLPPGINTLEFGLHHAGSVLGDHKLTINYIPLPQLISLHLAIMVANDSSLLFSSFKQGAMPSTLEYDRYKPVNFSILGPNGRKRTKQYLCYCLKQNCSICTAGSDTMSRKQTLSSRELAANEKDHIYQQWTALLHQNGTDGNVHRATVIDLRVDREIEGVDFYNTNGKYIDYVDSQPYSYSSHLSEEQMAPAGMNVVRVEVHKCKWSPIEGIRTLLVDAKQSSMLYTIAGEVRYDEALRTEIAVLVLDPGERVMGFYRRNDKATGYCEGVE